MPGRESGALFSDLEGINARPRPYERYTAGDLWTDEHTSARMLTFHLDEDRDLSSRKAAFIDRSVDWLASHLGIAEGVSVVDFGCGPGLYASRLARHGAVVTGIDFSARSIEYAREQARTADLRIRYLHQDYLGFTSGERFDVVLLIMCDLCALSPAQRAVLLKTFSTILKPGGRVVMDVYSLAAFDRRTETARYERNLADGFWAPGPYFGFLNTFKYADQKVILDKYTIVESARTRVVYNWFQHFSVESLGEECRRAGLAVTEVYADVAGSPYDAGASEFAVIAAKAQQ